MIKIFQSRGVKRHSGAFIVLIPMILKYLFTLTNQKIGTQFEIDDNLLNILYAVGASIWSVGSIHAYLPKILKWTIKIEKILENFNLWAVRNLTRILMLCQK